MRGNPLRDVAYRLRRDMRWLGVLGGRALAAAFHEQVVQRRIALQLDLLAPA